MGWSGGLMAGATLGNALFSVSSANAKADAIRAQGDYQKQVFEMNSRLAEMNAKDAIRRGEAESVKYGKQVKQTIGAQRAAYAAQGIVLDSGSALEVQQDTAVIGRTNLLTIKNNAYREAWGYKMDAVSASARGEFASLAAQSEATQTSSAGYMNAASTLLTGGGYLYSRSGGGAQPVYGESSFKPYAPGATSPGPWAPK